MGAGTVYVHEASTVYAGTVCVRVHEASVHGGRYCACA